MSGYRLDQTSCACPEQYNVYDGDRQVGYFRLRHGYFRAHLGSPSGPVVYEADTRGDGIFLPDEREFHLGQACAAIESALALAEELKT